MNARDLGPYRLLGELGRGSTGAAFLAEERDSKKRVCLKLLHPAMALHPEVVQRFHREIVLTNRIKHAGVCRLHGLHELNGIHFIAMEYVEGRSLHTILKDGRPLPIAYALAIGVATCAALTAAHDVGVIHRDLKPGNIMVNDRTEVKLLDFGLATAIDLGSTLTMPGTVLGTRAYIAPEVWRGEPASARSDQFALGVILYQAITGRLPYPRADMSLPQTMVASPAPTPRSLREDVPPLVDAILMRILSADPTRRFEDTRALGLVLRRAADELAAAEATIVNANAAPVSAAPPASGSEVNVEAVVGALFTGLPLVTPSPAGSDALALSLPAVDDVESGSWVVNGQSVGQRVQPKAIDLPMPSLAAQLEPEEIPVWVKPKTRFPVVAAVVLFVVLAASVAAYLHFR